MISIHIMEIEDIENVQNVIDTMLHIRVKGKVTFNDAAEFVFSLSSVRFVLYFHSAIVDSVVNDCTSLS